MDRGVDDSRQILRRRPLGPAATVAVIAVPILFLGYFFLYPLIAITARGLVTDGRLDLGIFGDVITDRTLRGVAAFTLWQAILSTLLTLAAGLPTAWIFARFSFPGKRILGAATLVPFVLPTLVVATAFLNLFGPRGISRVDLTGTLLIILIAHVFYNFAVVVRTVGSYWSSIDPHLEEAARTLGASPWQAFRTVTLPVLAPAIASASALVFLFSFTSFGVVLILGDLAHSTLEVEIWRQTTSFLRLDIASAIAVVQIFAIGVILAVYGVFERRMRTEFRHLRRRARRPHTRSERVAVYGILGGTFLYLGIPLAFLVGRSLSQPSGGVGLENFRNLLSLPDEIASFIDPATAIANSLRFALIAVFIAVCIGLLAAAVLAYAKRSVSSIFDVFVMLPLGTSAVTIGFGFLVALDRPIDLRTSIMLIPIAHALVGIPFVVRAVGPALSGVQHQLREAAATLGASPWRTFLTIDARIVLRTVFVGAAFAFAISMGEFGATTFIARPNSPTIPIAIFRYLGRPGEAPFGAAIAMSVVLMVVTGAAILLIDALGSRDEVPR
jgi:thiamine transport system permease protein